jgi:N-acyl-D-amino-acid deacylase
MKNITVGARHAVPLLIVAASTVFLAAQPQSPFDVLICGGRVIDGTGNPWVRNDIGVRGGRIAAIGRLTNITAARVIDAGDRVVTPGFIDVHSHAAEALARPGLRQAQPMLAQGVTTLVVNPDGGGPVDMAAQRAALERGGVGVNVALLIGHGSVRRAVIGMDDRAPTAEELDRMRELVRRAIGEGAYGVSSGLFYAPASSATTDEVVALAQIAGAIGGVYTSHIRDESNYSIGVVAAVSEVITIAEKSGAIGIVTHMKALGPDNWGLSLAALTRIDHARTAGVQVFADQYPYEASSTGLSAALVPRWALAGGDEAFARRAADAALRPKLLAEMRENLRRRGGPASLVIAHYRPDHSLEGKHLGDIAAAMKKPPEETALDLLARGSASVVSFNMTERDIEEIMRRPYTMTSSDGGLVMIGEGKPHPRNYGAFARKLARYVRDRQIVDLEFAIRSMTTLPSLVFRLRDRGVIREGAWADIAVFDPAAVRDTATYQDPHRLAEGMSYVIVNGEVVVDNGRFTEKLVGRVLRRE